MIACFSSPSLHTFLFLSPLVFAAIPQSFNRRASQLDARGFGAAGLPGLPATELPLAALPYAQVSAPPTAQRQPCDDPSQLSSPYAVPPAQAQGLKPISPPLTPPTQTTHNPIPAANPLPVSQSSSPTNQPPANNPLHNSPWGSSSTISTSPNSKSNPPSSPKVLASDIDRWLQAHNNERNIYRVNNVTWNPDLVAAAHQRASTCHFQHTPNNQYGENIAAGQQSIEEVCNDWANGPNEKNVFNPTSVSGSDTHWTQMVWDTTKEIGCCHQTCQDMGGVSLGAGPKTFWVCEYHPAGNVIGQSAEHVHAGSGGRPPSSNSQVPQNSPLSDYASSSYTKPETTNSFSNGTPFGYRFPWRMKRHLKSRWFSQKHKRLG